MSETFRAQVRPLVWRGWTVVVCGNKPFIAHYKSESGWSVKGRAMFPSRDLARMFAKDLKSHITGTLRVVRVRALLEIEEER